MRVALARNLRLGDSRNIQLRWEIFNVLNHTNFNAPVTALNSANFGKIITAQDPRLTARFAQADVTIEAGKTRTFNITLMPNNFGIVGDDQAFLQIYNKYKDLKG